MVTIDLKSEHVERLNKKSNEGNFVRETLMLTANTHWGQGVAKHPNTTT